MFVLTGATKFVPRVRLLAQHRFTARKYPKKKKEDRIKDQLGSLKVCPRRTKHTFEYSPQDEQKHDASDNGHRNRNLEIMNIPRLNKREHELAIE